MKKAYLALLLFAIILGGILFNYQASYILSHKSNITTEDNIKYCKAVIPQAYKCIRNTGNIPYFQAYTIDTDTKKDKLIGIAFITTDIVPEITGYSGKIKMIVGLDLNGNITKIHIISHSETPRYVKGLGSFIKQFEGKSVKEPMELNKDINAITGATITSKAIVRAIRKSLYIISKQILKIKLKSENKSKAFPIEPIIIPLILFAMAIYNARDKKHKYKWFILIFSLVYLGIIKSQMLSIIQIANIGLFKIPTFYNNPLWYALIILTLLSLLFFGNIYCSSICPFGVIQEILKKITSKLRLEKIRPSPILIKKASYRRYYILFGAIILSYILGNSDTVDFETFVILFSSSVSILGISLVIFMLITSLFHFRFWCKYLCPIGSFNSLIPRLNKKTVAANIKQAAVKQKLEKTNIDDKIFLVILVSSYILILSIIATNLLNTKGNIQSATEIQTNIKTSEKTITNKQKVIENNKIKKIKNKLESLDIKPHIAKYWEKTE